MEERGGGDVLLDPADSTAIRSTFSSLLFHNAFESEVEDY